MVYGNFIAKIIYLNKGGVKKTRIFIHILWIRLLKYLTKYPILDTRIFVLLQSFCQSRLGDPLDSEMGLTGDLWLNTDLLKYKNKGKELVF